MENEFIKFKADDTAHKFMCEVFNEIEEKIGHKLKMYNGGHEEYDFERDSADASPFYRLDDLIEGLKPFYVNDIEETCASDIFEYDGIKYLACEGLDKIIFHSIRYAPQVYRLLEENLGKTPIQDSGIWKDYNLEIKVLDDKYDFVHHGGCMFMND